MKPVRLTIAQKELIHECLTDRTVDRWPLSRADRLAIEQAMEEIRRGETRSWEDIKRELGL